jgi:hypothetical protein
MDPRLSLLAFDGPDLVGLLLAHADGPGPPPAGDLPWAVR